MRFVSLFSGVGGFDLGLEAVGWQCVAQVEWDQHCQAVLAHHWPDVPRWGDVADVSGHELPAADAVVFGSPCQDLSVAGKRAGFGGERSVLFYEAIRIIKEMRDATRNAFPRFVIWENVAGALSSSGGRDFAAVLDALAELGAVDISWRVLDARWFGVPQRRRRVFVVADLAGECAGAIHAESEGVSWHPRTGRTSGQEAAARVGSGTAKGGDVDLFEPASALDENWRLAEASKSSHVVVESYQPHGHGSYSDGVGTLRAWGGDIGGGSETLVVQETTGPWLARDGKGVDADGAANGHLIVSLDARPQAVSENQRGEIVLSDHMRSLSTGGGKPRQGYPAVLSFGWQESRYAGETWSDETSALTTTKTPAIHATQVRRLTPIECERLMGWPDDHTRWRADGTEVADSHRYRMCGNGVASPVAEWIADQLNAALEGER